MIAALPMYFPPAGAVEAFWQALASVLNDASDQSLQGQVPEQLTWPTDYHAHWQSGDFLISQTCGYPLCTELSGKVQVLGTFAYDVPGADGVLCTSQLICRTDDARRTLADFEGCTLAFNATDSQSGYNALRAEVATQSIARPFFGKAIAVGAHGKAIETVRTGGADMASIDCVTLALWQRANPALASQIRVFGRTKPYPGLPLITSLNTPPAAVAALRRGLAAVANEAQFAAVRAPLLICGFTPLVNADYAICLEMRALAQGLGLEAL